MGNLWCKFGGERRRWCFPPARGSGEAQRGYEEEAAGFRVNWEFRTLLCKIGKGCGPLD